MYRLHGSHHGRSLVFRDSKDPMMPCRVKVQPLVCYFFFFFFVGSRLKVVICLPLMLNSVTVALVSGHTVYIVPFFNG